MNSRLSKIWNSILRIGQHADMNDFEQMRLFTINVFMTLSIGIVFLFSATFTLLGSSTALEGLTLIPFFLLVFYLNYKRKFIAARILLVYGLIIILTILAISDRRTGTEYCIIAIGCCSVLIFDGILNTIFSFCISFLGYLTYVWYDTTNPFVPEPNLPYPAMQSVLMFLSGFIVVALLMVFRSTLKEYGYRLKSANEDIHLINEELQSSNDELVTFTENLDSIVQEKKAQLKAYNDAIDFNTCSAFITTSGMFTKINEPFAEVCGYAADELKNKNFNTILPDNSKDRILQQFREVNILGSSWSGELKIKHKTSGYQWIECVIIPIKNSAGIVSEYLFIGFPITERKENQQIKERTLGLLESIAFKTSHEIRGPISTIDGLVQLLKENMIAPEEFAMIAEMFSNANNDLRNATSHLVQFVNERLNDYMKK